KILRPHRLLLAGAGNSISNAAWRQHLQRHRLLLDGALSGGSLPPQFSRSSVRCHSRRMRGTPLPLCLGVLASPLTMRHLAITEVSGMPIQPRRLVLGLAPLLAGLRRTGALALLQPRIQSEPTPAVPARTLARDANHPASIPPRNETLDRDSAH